MQTIFFLLLSLLLLYSVTADTNFIRKTCKSTKYFEICMSSLESNPASQTAPDTRSLALIMIAVGVANSTATSAYLSSQLPRNIPEPNGDALANGGATTMKKVLKECVDKYGFAAEALQSAAQDLAADNIDYAYVHVSAAADYPNSCHNAFRGYPGLAYPGELARREDGLKRICDVVLGIIDGIGEII